MCNRFPVCLRVAWLVTGLFLAGFVASADAQQGQRATVPAVNTASRAQVLALYRHYYLAARPAPGWTGSVAVGNPGTVSADFLRATLRRINYFRAMSGLRGDVVFDPANNARCQQAALMMAAERQVSHHPPPFWKGYTPAAAEASAHSDLCMNWTGDLGPGAIDIYMADDEANNADVGHRRWLLYPATTVMGAGIVPAVGREHPGANAVWIKNPPPFTGLLPVSMPVPVPASGARLATAWPPAGFVPAPLLFARWSFSCANADFHSASVRVVKNGVALPVVLERPAYQTDADGSGPGVGLNTLVWALPTNMVHANVDESYQVQVIDVRVNGVARSFSYPVVSIDPSSASRGQDKIFVPNDLAPGADPALVSTLVSLRR